MRSARIWIALVFLAGCVVGESLQSGPVGDDDDDDAIGGADAAPGGGDPLPGSPDAGPPAATQQSVLAEFGGCMQQADWDANNLGQIALTVTDIGEVCADCHSAGNAGNFLSADSTATFEMIKTYPYVLKYATTDAQLNVIKSDRLILKGQEAGAHPKFELALELQQGLQNFYDLTNARYLAGTCL